MTSAKWARRERKRQRTDLSVAKILASRSLSKAVGDRLMSNFEAALVEGLRLAREKAEAASATKSNRNEELTPKDKAALAWSRRSGRFTADHAIETGRFADVQRLRPNAGNEEATS